MKEIWRDFPLKGFEPFKGATAGVEKLKGISATSEYVYFDLNSLKQKQTLFDCLYFRIVGGKVFLGCEKLFLSLER